MVQRWIFSIINQFSVSHDPSEIILICWFAAQETFLIIINVVVVLITIFVEICKIINIFTVTFDQFNASLLHKACNTQNVQNCGILHCHNPLHVFSGHCVELYNVKKLFCVSNQPMSKGNVINHDWKWRVKLSTFHWEILLIIGQMSWPLHLYNILTTWIEWVVRAQKLPSEKHKTWQKLLSSLFRPEIPKESDSILLLLEKLPLNCIMGYIIQNECL